MAHSSRSLIFSSPGSQIYRVRATAKRGPFIIKITTPERGRLLQGAETELRHAAHVSAPPLLCVRLGSAHAVAVYVDLGLVEVQWSSSLAAAAMDLLALVHDTDELTFRDGQSHTPAVNEVVAEVRRWNNAQSTFALQWGHGLQSFVDQLLTSSASFLRRLQAFACVPCHGDAHAGNFLWSPSTLQLYLIDWEYAHTDVPFFDLYQFFDATSPTQPLVRPGARLTLIQRYWQQRQWETPFMEFYKMYLEYAMWHHLWILKRIEADTLVGRFPEVNLARQTAETIAALCDIQDEYMHIDYGERSI